MKLFLAVYRLLRAVYSSTGGEWPGEEATAEADTNMEQQLCVSHSSPWMASTSKRQWVLHVSMSPGVCILQSTWS